jgi:hypothetical protein
MEEPVWKVMSTLPSKMPSKCEPVPTVMAPATTHTMLRASAPPASVICFAFDIVSVPETWKIQAGYVFILNDEL